MAANLALNVSIAAEALWTCVVIGLALNLIGGLRRVYWMEIASSTSLFILKKRRNMFEIHIDLLLLGGSHIVCEFRMSRLLLASLGIQLFIVVFPGLIFVISFFDLVVNVEISVLLRDLAS